LLRRHADLDTGSGQAAVITSEQLKLFRDPGICPGFGVFFAACSSQSASLAYLSRPEGSVISLSHRLLTCRATSAHFMYAAVSRNT
jgi:hypothetical protein